MGNPVCPELAFSTASTARKRMVLIEFSTRAVLVVSRVSTAAALTTLGSISGAYGRGFSKNKQPYNVTEASVLQIY